MYFIHNLAGIWGMNVHVPGQDVTTVRGTPLSLIHHSIQLVQGFTWFGSIIAVLACFGIVGSFVTYRMIIAR